MLKAGVIGLGVIGGGVSICLARTGQLEAVYDVRPDAADALPGVPPVAASAAEVARRCDVILTAVIDAAQTTDVLTGPNGVLAQARPGLSIVILSTIAIDDLDAIRALTDAAGVALIDCGVTGGRHAANNGLVCLVGGAPEAVARVRPVLDGFAKLVVHMGPAGAGMVGKIARNVIVYEVWRAGYEGAKLAAAAGIDLVALADVIEASAEAVGGPAQWMRNPRPEGDADEIALRQWALNMLSKDLHAGIDLGRKLKVPLPVAEIALASGPQMLGLTDD
jgi:3-hydroxyisobutyrate dehydrogenase